MKELLKQVLQKDNLKLATQVIPAVTMLLLAVFGLQHSAPTFPPIAPVTAVAAEEVAPEQSAERMEKPEAPKADTEQHAVETGAPVKKGTGHFTDGVHNGTGNGFHGPVKVKVTVKDGQITAIDVLSNQDDASFFDKAKKGLIPNILKAQTWDVDSVSGASYSSRGIKEAVKNALTGETAKSAATTAAAPETPVKLAAVTPGTGNYTDGVHTGTGNGFRGPVTVKVTVKNHQISDIDVVSFKDDASFFNRAKALISTIKTAQTWEVDSVSGASYSSRGIKEAVKNALTGSTSTSSTAPAANTTANRTKPAATKYTAPKGGYKDGTFYGTAKGFGGDVKTRVDIKNGKIASVSVVSAAGETTSFLNKAKAICRRIVSKQSPNVDTVSGATYSSNAIREGAKKALNQAAGKSSRNTQKKKKTTVKPSGKKLSGKHKNGTFAGTAKGFGGDITVKITIKNNAITKISVTKASKETPSFLNKAKEKVIPLILSKQTTKVDGATGATFSSKGIKNAVAEALKKATGSSTKKKETSKKEEAAKKRLSGNYPDGIYTGTAKGFGGDVTVKITIKSNAITKIAISKADKETSSFLSKAKERVIPLILSKQTTKVDGAAGATYSSNGIKNAVAAALKKAKSGSSKKDDEGKKEDNKESAEPSGKTLSGDHKDGTYTGTGKGFGGDLKVKVTIRKNVITKLEMGDNKETPSFLSKAKETVFAAILKEQTDKVDAAAGATRSSDGIRTAVANALKKAKTGDTSDDTQRDEEDKKDEGKQEEGDKKDSEKQDEDDENKDDKDGEDQKEEDQQQEKKRNGTYTGKGTVQPDGDEAFAQYTLSIRVRFSDGTVTSIDNLKISDVSDSAPDYEYEYDESCSRKAADKLFPAMKSKQSADVDTVSGATCSSRAIREAFTSACKQADQDLEG